MAEISLMGESLQKFKLEYHEIFDHILGGIQHIPTTSRIGIFYTAYRLGTIIYYPTPPGFQGIKRNIQFLADYNKKPTFYT